MYRLVAPGGVKRRALLAVSEETKDEEEETVQELADPWAQVPKTAKSWPVWLIITIGAGVALSVVLLVTIIVCTEKRRRKAGAGSAVMGAVRRMRTRRSKSPEHITGVQIEL
jgi:heme/copper-type cytochrome/quinol oxidase subunit 2